MSMSWEEIKKHIIEDAVDDKKHSVYIHFTPSGEMSITIQPWPDAEELYDMYQKGRITANDFRVKMGLPLVKNAERFMKRDFLSKEMTIPSDSDLMEKIRVFLNDELGFAIPLSEGLKAFEDAFSTEHLIDITRPWQLARLDGMRLYCPGIGYGLDDLNIYEQYLIKRTERLQAELKTKKR